MNYKQVSYTEQLRKSGSQKSTVLAYLRLCTGARDLLPCRIVVDADHAYPNQGYAHLDTWGVGGWNEAVRMLGSEVKEHVADASFPLEPVVKELLDRYAVLFGVSR